MKPTFALSLAVLLVASGCLSDDDADPALTADDDPGAIEKHGNPSPPPPTNLVSVSVTPSPLPGGHPASGILTLSGLQGNGGGSALVSSDPAVLSVPSEFFALATQSVGWFNVVTTPVAAPTPVTITATQNGTGNIEVDATSTNPNAILSILSVFFLPGDFEGFKLVNNGGGRYSARRPTTSSSVPPQIYVRSNFGGVSPPFDL